MLDIVFVLIYFLFPLIAIYLFNKLIFNILQISIPSFLIISMFMLSYVGLLPLYFHLNEYYYLEGIKDKILIFYVLLASAWSIFSLILGFIYSKYILKIGSISSDFFRSRPLHKKENFFLLLLFTVSICVLFVYLKKVPSVALFSVIFNDDINLKLARSLMGNDFAGKYHWYKLMMRDLLNTITFILFASLLIKKEKINFILFSISFLASSFSTLMSTEKAPFIWLCVGLFIVYVFVKLKGVMPINLILKFALFLLSILIVIFIFFAGIDGVSKAIVGIFSRAFAGAISPAYYYLEYFPLHEDFLYGRSFPNPRGIFPFESYRLTVEIMNYRHPELLKQGIVGSAPTVFWGEMYANFGLLGIALVPFFVGIILYIISSLFSRLENTPIKIGLIISMILHYRTLSVTGVSSFIFDIYVIVITSLLLTVIFLGNNFKIKLFPRKRMH